MPIRRWLSTVPLYAFVVAAPALLDFAYANRSMTYGYWILTPLLLLDVVVAGIIGLTWLHTRDLRRSGGVAAILMALFVGHSSLLPWARIPLWLLGIGVCVALMFVWKERLLGVLTTFANIGLPLFALQFVVPLVQYGWTDRPPHIVSDLLDDLPTPSDEAHPNFYLVVLDGYGRADVLRRMYQYDDPLPDALRKRGFVVPPVARANYCQTGLVFPSLLNLDYLPALLDDIKPVQRYRRPLKQLVEHSRVTALARSAGYTIVSVPGEYSMTHIADADRSHDPIWALTEYGHTLLNKTALPAMSQTLGFPRARLQHELRRWHVSNALSAVAADQGEEGPVFVYAHIVAPHPPFLWQPDGSYRPAASWMSFDDASTWLKSNKAERRAVYGESYSDGYRASLAFLGTALVETVDEIIARDPAAVIVLVADHGPGRHTKRWSQEESNVWERMSILSAYRVPGADDRLFNDHITPVNGLRLAVDNALGTNMGRLADKSLFSVWKRPYDFSDVTNELRRTDRRPTRSKPAR
jgi:hypothetical protein